MDLDRQSIERRDFPIARRGYEPATVDAHLRAVAAEVAALREELQQGGGESLALTAGSQVQGILQAAETTAAEIIRQSQQSAAQTRSEADRQAQQTRAEAIAQAQAHGEAVSSAAGTLLGKVDSLDGEVGALVQAVREGAGRLSGDLAALNTSMAELYDSSAGQASPLPALEAGQAPPLPVPGSAPALEAGPANAAPAGELAQLDAAEEAQPQTPAPAPTAAPPAPTAAAPAPMAAAPAPNTPAPRAPNPRPEAPAARPPRTSPPPLTSPAHSQAPPLPPAGAISASQHAPGGDLDSARLVALNMALNGDSREATAQYLAEHFQLADRQRLIEEVYAAIEG